MICDKCKKKIKGKYIELHHIYPKEFGGTDADGRIYLCKTHHKEIHNYLKLLEYITKEKITEFTNDWLLNKKITKNQEKFPMCPKCKDIEKRLSIREVSFNDLLLGCAYCGHTERNKELFSQYIKRQKKDIAKGNEKLFLKKIGLDLEDNEGDGDCISEV